MKTTWRETLAWCAGFFDGEGHVGFTKKGRRLDLYLAMSQTDRAVLDRFRDAVGIGKVTGPYERHIRRPAENDVYYFQTARFENVQAIIAMLWAFLSPIKRAQATAALVEVRKRAYHQPTCRNGHLRSVNLVMVGPKSQWRACRQCQRDKEHTYRVRRLARALLEAV